MKKQTQTLAVLCVSYFLMQSADAMELDWSGQFRTDFNRISNYTLDNTTTLPDPNRQGKGGYYVTPGGNSTAVFETLYLRLKPKLVVNDNIYVKSEFSIGDPALGLFGDGAPYAIEQRQFYSTQNRGASISAQRFWGEFITDVGTVQVGRAPLQWGLGLVWSSGDGLWDRFESTADVIRLFSKFGALTLQPSFNNYSTGNAVGGACIGVPCTPAQGSGAMTDYSLAIKYDNTDEDFEGGVNFIKRLAGASQDPNGGGYLSPDNGTGPVPNPLVGANYNIWDIYAKKKFGKLDLAGEVPITSGSVGISNYSTFAVAGEANYRPNEMWETNLKLGHAPGQPGSLDQLKAFYFNPNYRLGLIMFNYNFYNFAGPNTLNNPNTSPTSFRSPFYNPIENANYLFLKENLHTDKWTFGAAWMMAKARETAALGQLFHNRYSNTFQPANGNQSDALGWEVDLGATFQWDEYLQFKLDTGFYFPGDFYKFSNQGPQDGSLANNNGTSMVFATVLGVGVSF